VKSSVVIKPISNASYCPKQQQLVYDIVGLKLVFLFVDQIYKDRGKSI
jgi:hypothetical protein